MKTMILILMSLSLSCKGEINKIDFGGIENKSTIFIRDSDTYIQYGVDHGKVVNYVVISSGLDSSALVVKKSLSINGNRNTTAHIEIGNNIHMPPNSELNLVYCDKSGISRVKLKNMLEDELLELLAKITSSKQGLFFKVLADFEQ